MPVKGEERCGDLNIEFNVIFPKITPELAKQMVHILADGQDGHTQQSSIKPSHNHSFSLRNLLWSNFSIPVHRAAKLLSTQRASKQ